MGQWPHPTTSEVGWEENSFEFLVLNVELGLRLPELFGPRNDMLLSVAGGVYPECKHIEAPINIGDTELSMVCVSMGNPG